MLNRTRKHIFVFILVLFAAVNFLSLQSVHAETFHLLSKTNILRMNKTELLDTLQGQGLELPEDFALHKYMAENFVYHFTPLILNGEIDPIHGSVFNYSQSIELFRNLVITLSNMGLFNMKSKNPLADVVLKDLESAGSFRFKTTTNPTLLPDNYFWFIYDQKRY